MAVGVGWVVQVAEDILLVLDGQVSTNRMAPWMSIHCSSAIRRTASTLGWCNMAGLHHDVLI
eukprot:6794850-Prorocentrum_lima.AAC.1